MSAQPRQKTALVTGCSSGIGYALAKELAKRGYKVFACARRLALMRSLVEDYPDNVVIFVMDISSPESIEKGYQFVSSQLPEGKLDILYNNAGSSCTFPAIDVPDSALNRCLGVNVVGPVRVTHRFSRLVIAAQGTICFTGSLAGVMPFPWSSIYGGSKAFIHQYASILSLEMQPFNVRVINFLTGAVRTNIADTRPLPKGSIYNIPETVDAFRYRQSMAIKNHPMDPFNYASKAINEIEHGPRWRFEVHLGTYASIFTWVAAHLPRWLILWGVRIKFLLNPIWNSLHVKYVVSGADPTDPTLPTPPPVATSTASSSAASTYSDASTIFTAPSENSKEGS